MLATVIMITILVVVVVIMTIIVANRGCHGTLANTRLLRAHLFPKGKGRYLSQRS